MGPIGMQEMMAIFLIALLLFGPKKLPELGRLLGKGLSEFRRAKSELKSTFETHMRELEREANLDKQPSLPSYSTPYTPRDYSYPYEDTPYSEPASLAAPETAETPQTETQLPAQVAAEPAVNGTVARVNGTRPVGTEEHPAA